MNAVPEPQETRQQRRLAEKQKAKRLVQLARTAPLPSPSGLKEQSEVLLDLLNKTNGGFRASHVADATHQGFERSMNRHFKAKGLACRQGCAFCCHSYVSVSSLEALLVAHTILSLPEQRRDAVIVKVHEIDERTRGLSPEERTGKGALPCPLLRENRCSVYAVRPLSCRAEMSTDASACERLINGLKAERLSPVLPSNLKIMYSSALAVATKQLGLQAGIYEFNAALRIALDTKDAESRWLAGEDVFAPAVVHPTARNMIGKTLSPTTIPARPGSGSGP